MATEVQVDNSCLPPVQEVCRDFAVLEDGALAYFLQEQEIEQHFSSNVQKNQLVQKDLQVARRLQGLEAEVAKIRVSRQQREGRDSPGPCAPQEEMEQRVAGRRRRKEEEGHQEIVRRLQDMEEERSRRPQRGAREGRREPLGWRAEEGEIQSREQLRQDEALARKLQEEERSHLRAWRNQERRGDYRAAQVAQDEEIARYIQDQELNTHGRKPSQGACCLPQPGWRSCGDSSQEQSPGSDSGSPRATTGVGPTERPERPTPAGGRQPLCRNIAEDLDPTFRAKQAERPPAEAFPISPQGNVFGYLDTTAAPPFVPPTKRQPDKVGYQKPRNKREGCKQQ